MRTKLTLFALAWLAAACGAAEDLPDGWIDRIEGDVAVVIVEDGGRYRETVVPLARLPAGAEEGDVVRGGRLDRATRDAVRQRIDALQQRLLRGRSELHCLPSVRKA